MNIISIILVTIGCLIGLLLLIAIFSKKEYTVIREIEIANTKCNVFDYIRYLKNQDNYSKWVMMDPSMKKQFKGKDGTVGFVYGWDGNKKAGAGEQEIKSITEGKRIEMEIRFTRPIKGVVQTSMETRSISSINSTQEKTSVKWIFSSRFAYPINMMLLFMDMDKLLGKDLELSLNNLRSALEIKDNKYEYHQGLGADRSTI